MGKKYYAVAKGKNVGIYDSWQECQKQINGFSGSIFKSFPTLEQAQQYIKDQTGGKQVIRDPEKTLVIYSDGSFDQNSNTYSYGAVLIPPYGNLRTICGCESDPRKSVSRNVAGECMGVIQALRAAKEQEYKIVNIYHDYIGLGAWARGEWKTNTFVAKEYVKTLENEFSDMDIKFIHVRGHCGIKYNEMADELTAEGINYIYHCEEIKR